MRWLGTSSRLRIVGLAEVVACNNTSQVLLWCVKWTNFERIDSSGLLEWQQASHFSGAKQHTGPWNWLPEVAPGQSIHANLYCSAHVQANIEAAANRHAHAGSFVRNLLVLDGIESWAL
jgi:hypothetical protein